MKYTGTFDGGGYTISGLVINSSEQYVDQYVGLFGYVGSVGVVKNLTIASNGEVTSNVRDPNNGYNGGIVGYNKGAVQNCINSGTVSLEQDGSVGGIVGWNNGTVENCINLENVSGTYANKGGIVGYDGSSSSITNCGYLNTSADSGIGNKNDENYTNVSSFSSDEEAQIAVTLSASIADSAIAANGETTITLTTQPGTASTVMNAGGLSTADSSGLVTFTNNNDGTLTVRGNGSTGEAAITVTLYTYDYTSETYDTTASAYDYKFNLTVTEAEETPETAADPEETPSAKSLGPGGCNAGTGALALLALIPFALRRRKSK